MALAMKYFQSVPKYLAQDGGKIDPLDRDHYPPAEATLNRQSG
jgi:hypothetical protein